MQGHKQVLPLLISPVDSLRECVELIGGKIPPHFIGLLRIQHHNQPMGVCNGSDKALAIYHRLIAVIVVTGQPVTGLGQFPGVIQYSPVGGGRAVIG